MAWNLWRAGWDDVLQGWRGAGGAGGGRREGGREGGKEKGKEGGREGGREGGKQLEREGVGSFIHQ